MAKLGKSARRADNMVAPRSSQPQNGVRKSVELPTPTENPSNAPRKPQNQREKHANISSIIDKLETVYFVQKIGNNGAFLLNAKNQCSQQRHLVTVKGRQAS